MLLILQLIVLIKIYRRYQSGLINGKCHLIQILLNRLKKFFSRKLNKPHHPILKFNNLPVQNAPSQKHLGLVLDEKLNFESHLKKKWAKFNKSIGVIKKLQNTLPRRASVSIYKSFIRPHLDYGDIIYDQPNNESFCQKLEPYQYNAALAITGAIRGTSQTKIYNELGLESLRYRRYFRRLCTFFKIKQIGLPSYLFNLIPQTNHNYNTRQYDNVESFYCGTDVFKNSFFPSVIDDFQNLGNFYLIQIMVVHLPGLFIIFLIHWV